MTKVIAVTGGRDWLDNAFVTRTLDFIAPDFLILGDCPTGVDLMALNWAKANDRPHVVHKAEWTTHGRAAGPIRNGNMVKDCQMQYGVLVAFPGGRGTADCIRQARKAKLDVITCTTAEERKDD